MTAALMLSVDDVTLARIDTLASERRVSRDVIVKLALIGFLDSLGAENDDLHPWQMDEINAGRAAARGGGFASEEEMQSVLSKYGDRQLDDAYLRHLDGIFHEWNSPGDSEAFDDL